MPVGTRALVARGELHPAERRARERGLAAVGGVRLVAQGATEPARGSRSRQQGEAGYGGSEEDRVRMLELLVARLGPDNVLQALPQADYRP